MSLFMSEQEKNIVRKFILDWHSIKDEISSMNKEEVIKLGENIFIEGGSYYGDYLQIKKIYDLCEVWSVISDNLWDKKEYRKSNLLHCKGCDLYIRTYKPVIELGRKLGGCCPSTASVNFIPSDKEKGYYTIQFQKRVICLSSDWHGIWDKTIIKQF